ncbi:MAG: GspMb/PilO family protein [bacterium]
MKSILAQGRGTWVFMVGVVLVVLLFVGVALGPIRSMIQKLDDEIVAQEKQLAVNLRILAPSAKKVVEAEYSRYGTRIQKKGSSEEENSQMLSELDTLAGQNKVKLLSTKPRKTKVESDFEAYSVEIEVEADMPLLMGFIYGVESSAQLLRIDRLVIDSKGGGESVSPRAALVISKIVTL